MKENVIIYRTKFNLKICVNDLDAARSYLTEDDMTVYLKEEFPEIADDFISIEWKLEDEISGNIILKTNRELNEKELEDISEWISGQNSDGLGEGFEQQDFAIIDDEDSDYCECAEFDWRTNNYELERII